jgi:hypothetical protein
MTVTLTGRGPALVAALKKGDETLLYKPHVTFTAKHGAD